MYGIIGAVPGRWSAIPWRPRSQKMRFRSPSGLSASCIASSHFPNGMGRSRSSVMSPTDLTVLSDIPIITPSLLV